MARGALFLFFNPLQFQNRKTRRPVLNGSTSDAHLALHTHTHTRAASLHLCFCCLPPAHWHRSDRFTGCPPSHSQPAVRQAKDDRQSLFKLGRKTGGTCLICLTARGRPPPHRCSDCLAALKKPLICNLEPFKFNHRCFCCDHFPGWFLSLSAAGD